VARIALYVNGFPPLLRFRVQVNSQWPGSAWSEQQPIDWARLQAMRSLKWTLLVLALVGGGAAATYALYGRPSAPLPAADAKGSARGPLAPVAGQLTGQATDAPAPQQAQAAPPEKPLSLFPEGSLDGTTARLCYFSFNNPREYATTKRLVAHLNAHSPIQIEVVEFVQEDANIKKSLLAAIRSGTRCDGIVLSGHHRGKFWGDRSSGSVKANFLEEQACAVQNAAWFGHVKAVWLEGCNTGRQNLYNNEVKAKYKVSPGGTLGYIRAKLDFRDLEDSLDDIADVFDENLNDENLAKEYMRIFPYATVFGWTDKSPGEKAGSHYSFPYFLAQIVRIVDDDPRFLQNPMRGKLTPDSARRYSEALYAVLTRDPYGNRDGRPDILAREETYIQAWRDHSNVKYPFAFDNPSIAGYRSLVNNDNEILRQSTALRCVLEQEGYDPDTAHGVVAYLVRHEALTPIASQLLLAMAQSAPGLRGTIAESQSLKRYLQHARGAGHFQEFRRNDAATLLALLNAAPKEVAEQAKLEVATEDAP
jgi:hypothetical protein